MSASNQVMTQQQPINGAVMEKVILGNDLSGLTPIEKVQYVSGICKTLGLNPATNPIKIMKFQGKEIPYCSKDATEQLRKNNNVSISNIDTKIVDGIYIVTANATLPDGRKDSSTGVISIKGLVGDALANAMMKAETKAKRRVTLSICGLGFNDESEMDSLKNAKQVNLESHQQASANQKLINNEINAAPKAVKHKPEVLFNISIGLIERIDYAATLDDLKNIFTEVNKYDFSECPEYLKNVIDAKDERKSKLMAAKVTEQLDSVDVETGEIENDANT